MMGAINGESPMGAIPPGRLYEMRKRKERLAQTLAPTSRVSDMTIAFLAGVLSVGAFVALSRAAAVWRRGYPAQSQHAYASVTMQRAQPLVETDSEMRPDDSVIE